jgi:hypothetical protein
MEMEPRKGIVYSQSSGGLWIGSGRGGDLG